MSDENGSELPSSLQQRLDANKVNRRIQYATIIIVATLMIILGVVLAVFGNDVHDTLVGFQKSQDEQTKLIVCLIKIHNDPASLTDGQRKECNVKATEALTGLPQTTPAPTPNQSRDNSNSSGQSQGQSSGTSPGSPPSNGGGEIKKPGPIMRVINSIDSFIGN